MYFQAMVTYFTNLINIIRNKDIKSNIQSIEKMISIFNFLDMDFKAEQCQILLNSTLKHNQIHYDSKPV